MSDWLGEIKKRMKGPMISASMTNRVRLDMERLISEFERFQQKDGLRTREHNILVQENRNLTATIATLRSDNLLLAKKVSGLRKLNIAYRLGDQKLADAALTELEALATPAQEKK